MASLIDTQNGSTEEEILSLGHVLRYDNGNIGIELPYYSKSGAHSVHLQLSPAEALELVAKITNTVAHHL